MDKKCVAILIGALVGCADPVHDQEVKALGADDPHGIPDGPYHRAGQSCLACHGFFGPAKSQFSIAGTIFAGPDQDVAADQVTVELVDSEGAQRNIVTNCVGNFYIPTDDWDPLFPLIVWIRRGNDAQQMNTQIGREGSCSHCHTDPASFDSHGHVYLLSTEPATPPPPCPQAGR
jgi:hypothetical protein